jgi:hypothetical protein
MDNPDWAQLQADVLRRLTMLRAAWEHTAAHDPELHAAMKRDLYIPVLSLLAEFCASVEETEEVES